MHTHSTFIVIEHLCACACVGGADSRMLHLRTPNVHGCRDAMELAERTRQGWEACEERCALSEAATAAAAQELACAHAASDQLRDDLQVQQRSLKCGPGLGFKSALVAVRAKEVCGCSYQHVSLPKG